MAAVGIETYSRLLNEEIQKLKGETLDEYAAGPLLELFLSAYIPDEYLPSESDRIQMYKRILSAGKEGLTKIKEELIDRCGPLPQPVKTLIDAASLRLVAKEKGVAEVHQEAEHILIYFRSDFKLNEQSFKILLSQDPKVLTLIPGKTNGVRVNFLENENGLDVLGRFLRLVFP
jgi:transcription-repair coupling factor (superfamily II helicase)